ncbi:2,6-beta-D-fructofuranosidase [Larkinella terrae]|uniref:2,6-beta-D-fructofuranosidase n=1 Tax=Larkinella terrae TaxID=2025311 RepID=A0A7K0EEY5_9BACT|nr:2,6-beta-D-fructofuranosidase [Larkinella terrae]MRS60393.1 2,6-beta-D-fructofuranosidase [Larkinella terrae]
MRSILKHITLTVMLVFGSRLLPAQNLSLTITKRYLNLPVSQTQNRGIMQFRVQGKPERSFKIRLATDKPDYWVFCDVAALKGKTISISYDGKPEGLSKIYQDDAIAGQDSLYKEKNRPQYHFSTRRGWINDPNGMIFYEGEYHLFYQHNPYEREWENMSWGHAVSKDMIHWEELPTALSPDSMGTMFSGSTVIDYTNSAGFNRGNTPAMLAFFTVDNPEKEVQCLAYSLDKGRTWTKYNKNPLIDSKAKWNSKDTRDPRVFWYKPGQHWVMVLNERDGHSIYTSKNAKEWRYESHVTGFWECPDLFELPIDGDKNRTKWVMYGASTTYMIGSFDGKTFTPESGKHVYTTGSIYAAQTFTNMPESDPRRIQIGWGRIPQPGMPFNHLMLLPTELRLQTTQKGLRLSSVPVKETGQLFTRTGQWASLSAAEANEKLKALPSLDRFRVKATLKLSHATSAGLSLFGQRILDYDLNSNLVNGVFYSPEDMTSMEVTADIYVDQTSVEVFIDSGAYSYSLERKPVSAPKENLAFWGNRIEVKNLELYTAQSIWK